MEAERLASLALPTPHGNLLTLRANATRLEHRDILARNAGSGDLHAYLHQGLFEPGSQASVLIGFGWSVNDIIT
jgi:hypothetical protein